MIRRMLAGLLVALGCFFAVPAASLVLPLTPSSVAIAAPAPDVPGGEWTNEAFVIGNANAQKGWVMNIPKAVEWKPVPQPKLADALKTSPTLQTEMAGPPVRVIGNTRGHVLVVPNRDGKTWDAIFHYYQSYSGEQEVFVVDLGTGEQKTLWFNSDRKEARKEKVIPFGAWYARGKLFWPQDATGIGWYDPDTNDVHYKTFDGPEFKAHARHLGDDQNIYYFGAIMGKDAPKEKAYIAAVLDTGKMEMTVHDPVGPGSQNVTIFYPKEIKDGDWMYTAIGKKPWRIHAYNFKTREYRTLASAPIIGDYKSINFWHVKDGGVKGYIREPDFIDGVKDFDRKEFAFWLKDGKILARTGEIPPWSDTPAKEGPPRENLFSAWGNIQYWPTGWTPPSAPPYFDQDGTADSEGNVVRRYRWGNKGDWHAIALKVSSYPSATAALTEVNDHVLFGTSTGYGEHAFFDTAGKRFMGNGASGISGYGCGVTGSHFSVCGYPNSITACYDPTRALSRGGETPNPVVVNAFQKISDTHYPTAGIVGGADGRVYSAGHGAGRTRKGGGWSWYDPVTGEVGGQKFDWSVLSIADAAGGRYILMSGGGKLSCWDTTTHSFLYQAALDGLDQPGYIAEVLPGLLIGFTSRTLGEAKENVLYGLDPATPKVLWVQTVPVEWKSPQVPLYGNPYFFRRGPDGFLWTYFDNTLVRIDPRTAEVVPVGTLPKKAFLGFAGGEVYAAGEVGLQKVKGLVVPVVK